MIIAEAPRRKILSFLDVICDVSDIHLEVMARGRQVDASALELCIDD